MRFFLIVLLAALGFALRSYASSDDHVQIRSWAPGEINWTGNAWQLTGEAARALQEIACKGRRVKDDCELIGDGVEKPNEAGLQDVAGNWRCKGNRECESGYRDEQAEPSTWQVARPCAGFDSEGRCISPPNSGKGEKWDDAANLDITLSGAAIDCKDGGCLVQMAQGERPGRRAGETYGDE